MNSRGWVLVAIIVASCIQTQRAPADVRRESTARRPYIVEIGDPYPISRAALEREATRLEELETYLERYGSPDYAEIQEIRPEWPWDSYEVRLYYLRRNVQADFGRAFTLTDAYPHLGLLKFQGGIPASKRLEIELALRPPDTQPVTSTSTSGEPQPMAQPETRKPSLEELVARVEAAADRAAAAAEDAVRQSEAAERAANRTVDIVNRLAEEQQRAQPPTRSRRHSRTR